MISEKDVAYVARLARLALGADETKKYTEQFERILGHMEELKKLDTSKVAATTQVLGLKNVFRHDEPRTFDPKALLDAAPATEAGFFKVQKIIE